MTQSNQSSKPGAISALRWVLAGNIVQRIITLAGITAMARLVSETELGVYRQLIALHVVFGSFASLGFDYLLIRNVDEREKMRAMNQAAVSLTVTALSLVWLVGIALWANLLQLENWMSLLWFFPLVIGFQGWKSFYKNRLVAELSYKKIMTGEMLYTAVSMIFGVAVVLLKPTADLLYLAYGLAELTEAIYLKRVAGFKSFDFVNNIKMFFDNVKQYAKTAGLLCADTLFNTLGSNAPILLLGALVSKASAAGFSMANWVISVPIFLMIGALTRVAFPVLAGLPKSELKNRVLFIVKSSAVTIVPVLLLITVFAEPLVHVALGKSWVEGTVPLVRWISVYYIFVVLFSPIGSLDVIMNRVDLGLIWNIVMTVLRIAAIYFGIQKNVETAIAWFSIVSVLMWLVWGMILGWLAGCSQKEFHKNWISAMPAWIAFSAMLIGLGLMVSNPYVVFVLSIIPIVVYGVIVLKFYPDVYALLYRFGGKRLEGFLPPPVETPVPGEGKFEQ